VSLKAMYEGFAYLRKDRVLFADNNSTIAQEEIFGPSSA
jgi:hypothetical protein